MSVCDGGIGPARLKEPPLCVDEHPVGDPQAVNGMAAAAKSTVQPATAAG